MKKFVSDLSLGILAGVSIAFGGLLNIFAKALFSDLQPWVGTLIGSLLFPVGLTIVCFAGFNLFTGKIGYLFDNKPKYLLFLLTIYVGNIIGSLIVGLLIRAIPLFSETKGIIDIANAISNKKMLSVGNFTSMVEVFIKSCFCGMLVYIAVFAYKTFKNTLLKVIGIFIPIAVFVYFGFDHCVANMFYFTYSNSWLESNSYLNILIATLGNSVGAIALNSLIKAIKKSAK